MSMVYFRYLENLSPNVLNSVPFHHMMELFVLFCYVFHVSFLLPICYSNVTYKFIYTRNTIKSTIYTTFGGTTAAKR